MTMEATEDEVIIALSVAMEVMLTPITVEEVYEFWWIQTKTYIILYRSGHMSDAA